MKIKPYSRKFFFEIKSQKIQKSQFISGVSFDYQICNQFAQYFEPNWFSFEFYVRKTTRERKRLDFFYIEDFENLQKMI